MSRYAEFDKALMSAISSGTRDFSSLWVKVHRIADALPQTILGERDSFRVVDRRLQALRKAGKIAYTPKGGWAITQQAEELK